MSQAKRAAKQHTKKRIIVASIVMVAIVVIVGAVLWAQRQSNNDSPQGGTTAQDETKAAIQSSDQLKYSKDYDQAILQASGQYENAQNDQDKYMLALQTATIYETKGDYKDAITWYTTANKMQPNDRANLSGLGRCYDASGDKAKAVEFYQKTIDSIDGTVPGADNDKAYYQDLLNKAQAAQ